MKPFNYYTFVILVLVFLVIYVEPDWYVWTSNETICDQFLDRVYNFFTSVLKKDGHTRHWNSENHSFISSFLGLYFHTNLFDTSPQ